MENKFKAVTTIASFVAILATLMLFVTENYTDKLSHQLEAKDKLLTTMLESDSAFNMSSTAYAEELAKYISKDCGIEVNGKTLTNSELISLLSKTISENDSLKQQLNDLKSEVKANEEHNKSIYNKAKRAAEAYRDTAFISSNILKLIKRDYGISYKTEELKSGHVTFTPLPSKVDSALWLYPYYKHKIIADKPGSYRIIRETEKSSKVK